jgi:peroxiredoxin
VISPQTPDHTLSMVEKNDLKFLVFSDTGAAVIDRYGLKYDVDRETLGRCSSRSRTTSARTTAPAGGSSLRRRRS